jgi:hypothetical protein
MGLLDDFIPDEMVHSVAQVDLDELADRGIRGVLIDVDNTLIGYGLVEIDPERLAWVEEAIERFSVCLLSNSVRGHRVQTLCDRLGCPGISVWTWDRKPFAGGMRRALTLSETSPDETAMIGDQLLTDILGGNRAGLYTIWVEKVAEREFFITRQVHRRIEGYLARRLGLRPGPEEAVEDDVS